MSGNILTRRSLLPSAALHSSLPWSASEFCESIARGRWKGLCSRASTPAGQGDIDHPWLKIAPASPPSLLSHERVLTFLAANTAAGKLSNVAMDWSHLPKKFHAEGMEVVLQTHLFAGFPRAINALATIHQVGVDPNTTGWKDEVWDPKAWQAAGAANCEKIYGDRVYPKLRERMQAQHPVLDNLMIEHGYGRVLSRPLLSLRMRELCVLAVLAGQDVAPQLLSHIKGAMRVGASIEEVETVIKQTELSWGREAMEQAEATLMTSDTSRYGR